MKAIVGAFFIGFWVTILSLTYLNSRTLRSDDIRLARIEHDLLAVKSRQDSDHNAIVQNANVSGQLRRGMDGYFSELSKVKTVVTRQQRSIRSLRIKVQQVAPGVTTVQVR